MPVIFAFIGLVLVILVSLFLYKKRGCRAGNGSLFQNCLKPTPNRLIGGGFTRKFSSFKPFQNESIGDKRRHCSLF